MSHHLLTKNSRNQWRWLSGFANCLAVAVVVTRCNLAHAEEIDSLIVADAWWYGWVFAGSIVLLVLAIVLVGLYFKLKSLRLNNSALQQRMVQLERELNQVTDRLRDAEQSNNELQRTTEAETQARRVFLARMSHALCTPLNGILGFANILRSNPKTDNATLDGLDIILNSGQQLQSLINDLLDGLRIDTGQLILHPEPVQLGDITDSVERQLQPKARAKGLALSASIGAGVPGTVSADEARLRQVLSHLLDKAVTVSEQGHVALIVETLSITGSEHGEASLRFTVESPGTEINPALLEKTLLPFEHPDSEWEEAGLGLRVCQHLVKKMGGKLHVERRSGTASRVWFDVTLPIAATLNPDVHKPTGAVCGYEGERRKILVVDDRSYNRLLLKAMLEPLGFEIGMADNGREAVEQATAWHPDAILMDLVMPGMSGFEAVQAIRQVAELKKVIIIAVSASVSDSGRNRSIGIGCNAYLSKPIRIEALLSLLGDLLKLNWVYTDTAAENDPTLIAPPAADLRVLLRLAEEGQVYEIRNYAAELENRSDRYRPFCKRVTDMAKHYELDQIADFAEKFLA